MAKRQTIVLTIVVLTLGAGLAYLYMAQRHRLWPRRVQPAEVSDNQGKNAIAAQGKSAPRCAGKSAEERPWEVGRPYATGHTVDYDELLDDPRTPPLTRALYLGDMGRAKDLIVAGANVNATDQHGNTPLMIAARNIELGAVHALLASGAAVNAKNDEGMTALFCTDSVEIAKELIAHGADVNTRSLFSITPLMGAVNYGLPVVRLLIANGASINARDAKGRTALMEAASGGQVDIVRSLIEEGADVNARDNDGETAMSRVQWHFKFLSQKRSVDSVSEAPMHQRQLRDYTAISKLLKRAGATGVR